MGREDQGGSREMIQIRQNVCKYSLLYYGITFIFSDKNSSVVLFMYKMHMTIFNIWLQYGVLFYVEPRWREYTGVCCTAFSSTLI